MTEILSPESAAERARELLNERVTVIERLVAAANARAQAAAQLDEADRQLASHYAEAERAGWTAAELAKFGVKSPARRSPGRPRNPRRSSEAPATA